MSIHHTCPACKITMKAPEHFAGLQVRCPDCSNQITLPAATPSNEEEVITAELVPDPPSPPEKNDWDLPFADNLHGPKQVKQFLEPPAEETPSNSTSPQPSDPNKWMQSMFAALLDPRSINWLLTLGGGLMVLGGLIWLISRGVFLNPFMAAIVIGTASLGTMIAGGLVVLRTRFQIAGRALTFLGCIFVSLNLWFYHVQGILLLSEGLWMAGVVCVLLFIATVRILRDPLFMYAVQAGITLTAVLILGSFEVAGNATPLSVVLMIMALASIHGHKAFPVKGDTFTQEKFGLPLFWCGHVQLAVALIVLLVTQVAGAIDLVGTYFELPEIGIPLTETRWVPGLLWLAGAYAYMYSDLVVRRIGVYIYFAAISLVMAESTLIGLDLLGIEGLIATLAMTATAISLVSVFTPEGDQRLARAVPPLALILSILPVTMGLWLHLQSTSISAFELGLQRETTWAFFGAMLLVAVANRVSAFIYQRRSESIAAVYLIFSAGALVVAAAGGLRMMELNVWTQVIGLMFIPLGYIIASRLWRGQAPERPVGWAAHATTVILLIHVLFGTLATASRGIAPDHLQLAIILGQTALFYGLAGVIRKQPISTFAAVGAGCASVWQLMLYRELPQEIFTTGFALVGIALILAARAMGVVNEQVYSADGDERTITRGHSAEILRSGHAILSIALLVAFMKGLTQLAAVGMDVRDLARIEWIALGLLTVAAIVGAVISPSGSWRRTYTVAAVGIAGVSFLTLNIAIDLSLWRKTEIFLVAIGLLILGGSYVGRFSEDDPKTSNETVSFGLWMGSMLATLPLIAAVFYHWNVAQQFSLYDELALIGITLVMVSTGVVWRVKAATLFGGGTLFLYLCVLSVSLIHQPQIAIGIYLAAGGGVLFLIGILLAIYRDHLLALPERVANREGVFEVIDWR